MLEIEIESDNDDYDTLGGFILNHAGTIPEKDYSFKYNGWIFTVKSVTNKRIQEVLVEKVDTSVVET